MIEEFNALPWHDANLIDIYIDRSNPGETDLVKFTIEWPEENGFSTIEFYECYALNARMNFGVVASESILQAECISDSPELNDIREKWMTMHLNLENLKCFRFITNSTNSAIDVFANGFRVSARKDE